MVKSILRSNVKHANFAIASLLISIVRNKIAAIILGAEGIGLLGLLQNYITLVARLSTLGLTTVGTQQISYALSNNDLAKSNILLWIIFMVPATISLAFSLTILVQPQLNLGFGFISFQHDQLFLLCLAIFFAVFYMSVESVSRAYHASDKFAVANLSGSFAAVGISGFFMFYHKTYGVYLLFILAPLLSTFFLRKLIFPLFKGKILFNKEFVECLKNTVLLGLPVTLSVPFALGGQYVSKITIADFYGNDQLGYFQAACTLSYAAVGFLISAMNLNYYPKLTNFILSKGKDSARLINKQICFGLIVCLPIVIFLTIFSGFFLAKFYTSDFVVAKNIFRWQVIGDYLRMIYMPLFFVSLATARTKYYLLTEILAGCAYYLAVLFTAYYGFYEMLGCAVIFQSFVYFITCYFFSKKIIGYKFDIATGLTSVLCIGLTTLTVSYLTTEGW